MHHVVLYLTSALTPDGGLINGVGALSVWNHLEAGQLSMTFTYIIVIDPHVTL